MVGTQMDAALRERCAVRSCSIVAKVGMLQVAAKAARRGASGSTSAAR